MVCVLPVIISAIENPKDRDLMTEFYLTQNTRMYAEAWKYLSTPEDVEDIVYEALTRIIEKIETFRSLLPPQRLQYAVTTVRNLSYIYTTRKNLHPTVPFEEICFELTTDSEDSPDSEGGKECGDKAGLLGNAEGVQGLPGNRIIRPGNQTIQ